jgi:hypothetical protein
MTCSNICRARKKRGYAPYADYTEPPLKGLLDLTVVQKLAQEAGLTYGQYVALDYSRRQRGGA